MRFVLFGLLGAIAVGFARAWYRSVLRRSSGHPWQAFRARRGWGLGVRELARRLGLPEVEVLDFEPRYRRTSIPKRRGGRRVLDVPSAGTKAVQRLVLRRLLARLRSHDAAHGFEPGRSIVTNALPHAGQAVVIRMDIVDFFPSTTATRVEAYFRRVGWNARAAAILTRMTTHEGGLPQGAPTSPRLSNLINVRLDHQLAAWAAYRGGRYTRYADDITFSLDRDYFRRVRGIIQYTKRTLKAFGYEMHERRKLSIRRRHTQQMVTGLVVNERVRLPRATRRWLRAVRHRHETKGDCTLTPRQLQGWTSLESMVNHPRIAEP